MLGLTRVVVLGVLFARCSRGLVGFDTVARPTNATPITPPPAPPDSSASVAAAAVAGSFPVLSLLSSTPLLPLLLLLLLLPSGSPAFCIEKPTPFRPVLLSLCASARLTCNDFNAVSGGLALPLGFAEKHEVARLLRSRHGDGTCRCRWVRHVLKWSGPLLG